MNNAIAKAIEGGYKTKTYGEDYVQSLYVKSILLDPLFWQALGKAEGWGDLTVSRDDWTTQPKYLYEWHRFIDHLAGGKPIDDFFNNLLK